MSNKQVKELKQRIVDLESMNADREHYLATLTHKDDVKEVGANPKRVRYPLMGIEDAVGLLYGRKPKVMM
jgi:hypothetical protein